jgi:hypothetical protein
VTGRVFFEEVIRENLDIGHPSQVSLVFDRRITRRTPGRFRTRVITHGVVPSLHVDYRKSRIEQYHKEREALRTETTINDTRDFGIGRRIENLSELRKIGFAANRRLLDVQRIGDDCFIGEAAFQHMQKPVVVGDQRAAVLRFADPRVQGLLHILLLFLLVQGTFRKKDLREHIAPLLGMRPSQLSTGRVTYDLRRLRLHALIERIPKTHRYRITAKGLRTAIFYTHLYTIQNIGYTLRAKERADEARVALNRREILLDAGFQYLVLSQRLFRDAVLTQMVPDELIWVAYPGRKWSSSRPFSDCT